MSLVHIYAPQGGATACVVVNNGVDSVIPQWAVRLPRPLTDAEIAAINNWCDDKAKVELYEKDMEHLGPDTLPYNANALDWHDAKVCAAAYQRHTGAHPQLSEAWADATRHGGSLKENLAQARHAELKRIKQKMLRHVAGATQAMTGARQAEPTKLERPLVNPMLYATSTISGGPAALHNLPQNPNQAMIYRDGPPKAKTPAALLSQPGPAPAKPTPPLPVADITRTGTHFGRWGAGL